MNKTIGRKWWRRGGWSLVDQLLKDTIFAVFAVLAFCALAGLFLGYWWPF